MIVPPRGATAPEPVTQRLSGAERAGFGRVSQHWKTRHEHDRNPTTTAQPDRERDEEQRRARDERLARAFAGTLEERAAEFAQAVTDEERRRAAVRAWMPADADGWAAVLSAALPGATVTTTTARVVADHPAGVLVASLNLADEWTLSTRSLGRQVDLPEDLGRLLAEHAWRFGEALDQAPLRALQRDGWDPCDTYWCAEQDEWTRPELPR